MKNLNLIICFAAVLVLFSGCFGDDDTGLFGCVKGEGESVTEILSVDPVTEINLHISADVFITRGETDEFSVEVEGQQNIIDEIKINTKGNEWDIDFDANCIKTNEDLKIFITMPTIEKLSICSSGDIVVEEAYDFNTLELEINGSGDILFEGNGDRINAKVCGSGDIELIGTVNRMKYDLSGSGKLRSFDMEALDADITVDGSGDVEVLCAEDLDVDIQGSGDVFYRGNPSLNVSIDGSGDVINAN